MNKKRDFLFNDVISFDFAGRGGVGVGGLYQIDFARKKEKKNIVTSFPTS
jgi:hypothetical protein